MRRGRGGKKKKGDRKAGIHPWRGGKKRGKNVKPHRRPMACWGRGGGKVRHRSRIGREKKRSHDIPSTCKGAFPKAENSVGEKRGGQHPLF